MQKSRCLQRKIYLINPGAGAARVRLSIKLFPVQTDRYVLKSARDHDNRGFTIERKRRDAFPGWLIKSGVDSRNKRFATCERPLSGNLNDRNGPVSEGQQLQASNRPLADMTVRAPPDDTARQR